MANIVVPIVLLIVAIGVLLFIAKELDPTKKRKVSGIMFFLLCILLVISQISYLMNPLERFKNFGGIFGFYSSAWIFWLIGFYFFIIPCILAYLGFIFLFKPEKKINTVLLYFVPIGVIIDTILALFLKLKVSNIGAGGTFGSITSKFLIDYFGQLGTYFILGFGMIIVMFMILKKSIFPKSKPSDALVIKEKPKKAKKQKKETKPNLGEYVLGPVRGNQGAAGSLFLSFPSSLNKLLPLRCGEPWL